MRILAISQKVFIELLRDKRTLLLLFAVPIFIMWLMNAAFSASTETDVTIAVVGVSENITKSLDDVQHITARDFQSQDSAQDALEKEKVDAILSFKDENHYQVTYANTDPGKTTMTRQVINSTLKQVQVQELIDNLKKAQQANLQAQVQSTEGQMTQTTTSPDDSSQINIKLSENYIYGDKNTTFFTKMTPILMGFFVFFFVFLISGMALLKERTSGTLDRLLATPVKRSDIVFGYMLAYSLVAALQTFVIVLSTIWLLFLVVLVFFGDFIFVHIICARDAQSSGRL